LGRYRRRPRTGPPPGERRPLGHVTKSRVRGERILPEMSLLAIFRSLSPGLTPRVASLASCFSRVPRRLHDGQGPRQWIGGGRRAVDDSCFVEWSTASSSGRPTAVEQHQQTDSSRTITRPRSSFDLEMRQYGPKRMRPAAFGGPILVLGAYGISLGRDETRALRLWASYKAMAKTEHRFLDGSRAKTTGRDKNLLSAAARPKLGVFLGEQRLLMFWQRRPRSPGLLVYGP